MKITLRLPDDLAEELRARSKAEGGSLNATVVAALRLGLGKEQPESEVKRLLGDFLARQATGSFDPVGLDNALAAIGTLNWSGVEEDLDWVRSDREL